MTIGTDLDFQNGAGASLLLDLMTPTPGSLVGYTGGGLCTLANVNACGGSPPLFLVIGEVGVDLASERHLTPGHGHTRTFPSFVLLGSGMLGLPEWRGGGSLEAGLDSAGCGGTPNRAGLRGHVYDSVLSCRELDIEGIGARAGPLLPVLKEQTFQVGSRITFGVGGKPPIMPL